MQVTENTRIRRLLRRFPSVEDMLGWYGIEVDNFDSETTVRDVAWSHRLELDDLLGDLQAGVDDELRDHEPDPDEEDVEDDDDDNYDDDAESEFDDDDDLDDDDDDLSDDDDDEFDD